MSHLPSLLHSILLLIIFSPSITSAEDFCASDDQTETQFPDYQVVMDWGVRVDNLQVTFFDQNGDVKKRAEIEYEYDERILYDEEPVSISSFWQGCESFIGKQDACTSDNSLSLLLSPDHLKAEIESKQGLVNSNQENLMEFSQSTTSELNQDGQLSEPPALENMFNMYMTSEDVALLGDFKQLSFRQAIRITFDINNGINVQDLVFEGLNIPSRFKSKNGLFVNTKIIIKNSYLSDYSDERLYGPYRIMVDEVRMGICDEEYCGFEFLAYDSMTVNEVLSMFNGYGNSSPENRELCSKNKISLSALNLGDPIYLDYFGKAVFHYEIQTSIINTKNVDNFNPLDYLDRDLTLPAKEDAGGLYYLLLIGVLVFFRRTKPLRLNHKTPVS